MAPRQRHVGTAPGALPRLCLAAAPPAESSVSAGRLRLRYGLFPKAAVPSPAFHLPLPSERSPARTRPPANFSNGSLTQARHASRRPAGRVELHTRNFSDPPSQYLQSPCHSTGFQGARVEVEAQLVQTREAGEGFDRAPHRNLLLMVQHCTQASPAIRAYAVSYLPPSSSPPPAPFNFILLFFIYFNSKYKELPVSFFALETFSSKKEVLRTFKLITWIHSVIAQNLDVHLCRCWMLLISIFESFSSIIEKADLFSKTYVFPDASLYSIHWD